MQIEYSSETKLLMSWFGMCKQDQINKERAAWEKKRQEESLEVETNQQQLRTQQEDIHLQKVGQILGIKSPVISGH